VNVLPSKRSCWQESTSIVAGGTDALLHMAL
jgi:hypothetical protein